ncbi:MAG: tetratricopeptide repeat protein, partial [Pyrinomonadaceae bacterium]
MNTKINLPAFLRGFALSREYFTRLLLCLVCCAPFFAVAQSADDTALGALAKEFFAAYQKQDLDGLMLLWSEKSPDLRSSKQNFQQTFAAIDKIEVKNLLVRQIKVDGTKATVRVVIESSESSAVDAKIKPAVGFGKMDRTLHCVKEDGKWKVWQSLSSEEELAAALVEAKTDVERKTMLESAKDLVTVELGKALFSQGRRLYEQGNYPKALIIYQLALDMSNRFEDKRVIADSLRGIGTVHDSQGNYTLALEYYQRSLKLTEELGDKTGIARALNNIGLIHQSQG